MAVCGLDLDKELLVAFNTTVFDLSGSAQSEVILYNKNHEILINKIWVKYVEATSADTGVNFSLGSSGTDNAYFDCTSLVSKDAGSVTEYNTGDLTLSTIPRDTVVMLYNDGGKVGTGTCHIFVAYSVI